MNSTIHTPKELGLLIRSARRQLGLTQSQLALAAGVGLRFMVDLEAGKPTLRLENALRVIQSLGGSICINGLVLEPKEKDRDAPT